MYQLALNSPYLGLGVKPQTMLRSTLGNPNNMLCQCQKMSKGDDCGGFSTRDNDLILL